MNLRKNIFYAILSGAALAVSFPPMPLFLLAFIAFIPLLIVLNLAEQKHKFLLVYITFFVYHAGTNWWISSWQTNTDPYLFVSGIVVCFFHPLFFLLPFALYFAIQKFLTKISPQNSKNDAAKNISLYLFPFIWTAFEWFHSLGDLSYPWLNVGYTQFTNIYWIQISDIAGIYGASFLVALVNILLYKIIFISKKVQVPFRQKFSWRNYINTTQSKICVILIYMALVIPMIYGYFAIKKYDYDENLRNNKYINVGLIQPNIDPWNKWKNGGFEQIKTHLHLQDSLVAAVGKLNLFIWSETAIPSLSLAVNRDLELGFIEQQLVKHKASLLTGLAKYVFFDKNSKSTPVTARYFGNDTSQLFCSYNSAVLLNPQLDFYGNIISDKQIYHKSKLTPFAEGFPFIEYLPFAKNWLVWGVGISSWEKGNNQENLIVKTDNIKVKIAPIVCIESIYPDFVRKFVAGGAEIISVITNDSWYNYTFGPAQHYMISALRAIENRRYIARCANSGISGFISPAGRDILRAKQYETTAVAASLPLLNEQTFYTKHSDFLPIFCLIVVFAIPLFYWIYIKKANIFTKF